MKAYNLNTAQRHREAVTELYLHHCGLSEVPALVFECARLRRLEITDNTLRFVPDRLADLEHLETLVLSGNRIEQLPETLAMLPRLRHLEVANNQLELFPTTLLAISGLEKLRLAGNRLTSLPPEIDGWQQLTVLDISNNALGKLPSEVGRLSNLREFYVNGNQLRRLPATLADLHRLERLEAADNRLRQLPPRLFSRMERLSRLDLSGNRLQEIPSSVGECRHLAHLTAARNKLKALPASVGHLCWLRRLNLAKNKLASLPPEIGGCTFLRHLRLSNNNVSALPATIEQLHRLEHLSLARNQLENLPVLPPGLLHLDLSHNRLSRIPASVMALPVIRVIDLGYNRLLQLPPALSELKSLHRLRLTGNEIGEWRSLILDLDQLEGLQGLAGGREKRQLLRFLKACRRQGTSRVLRPVLYDCYRGEAAELSRLTLDQLVEALRFPLKEVRLAVRRHLVEERGRTTQEQPLRAGAAVACVGKIHFDETTLQNRLSEQGILLTETVAEASHVVIGDRPAATVRLVADQVFLGEAQLNEFLDRSDRRYLALEHSEKQVDRVRQLLLHDKKDNIRLAVQLMKGGGVPASLLAELFFVWKRAERGALKRALRQLLELNLPESDRWVLSVRRSLSEEIPKLQLEENIRQITEGTSLEERKLRKLCGLE